MKKLLIILLLTSVGVVNGIFYSCKRDEMSQGTHKEYAADVRTANRNIENRNINYPGEQNILRSTTGSVKGRNGNRLKSVYFETYNTETVFVVELTYYTADYQSLESSAIKISVNGQELDCNLINRNLSIFSFSLSDLKPGWKEGDLVEWSFTETGSEEPISYHDSYMLVKSAGRKLLSSL